MFQLNRHNLPQVSASIPRGPAQKLPERILQFGEGNFLRGFADPMVDCLNRVGLFNGGVTVVQPLKHGLADLINAQDGIYTLLLRGIQQGQMIEERSIVTSINRCLNPYNEWSAVVSCATSPELRFVLSNTTEAGIVYLREDYDGITCPASFPAKVAALLLERFRQLGGTAETGLIFLPCELIENNGTKLREIVLRHANNWNVGPDFIAWLESANYFLNTLVDRIVPGYPGDEAAKLKEELGYEDRLMVAAEVFHLWVIEGPAHLAEEIPFHKIGLNVVWTDDMTPFRSRKVRVLNGAHTSTVPAAFLAGLNTVGEMMDDPRFGPVVRGAVFDEILPVLQMDADDKRIYAEAVLERFRNPFIQHALTSITLNSVSKWKVRVLPSLLDIIAANQPPPPLLTFSLAALIRFYDGTPVSENELRGSRNGQEHSIRDDASVLSFFSSQWQEYHRTQNLNHLVSTVLSNTELWGSDLTQVSGLKLEITRSLGLILKDGVRHALPN